MKTLANATRRTIAEIKADFSAQVEAYNASEDVTERAKIKAQVEKLTEEYNLTSKQTSYANCLNAENPMLTFIKTYSYPVLSTTVKKGEIKLTVKEDGKSVHNLWDFVEYCEALDRGVTESLNWKSKAIVARDALIKQVQDYVENGTEMTPGEFKVALQAAFDAVITIRGEKGGNAVVATSKNTRVILMTCGRLDDKNFKAQFVGKMAWQKQFFAFLNRAVENKTFATVYGEDETKAEEPIEVKPEEPKAEAKKATTKKSNKKSK